MKYEPCPLKQSFDYQGRLYGKPLYLPAIREAKTRKIVSVVTVKMGFWNAHYRSSEMAKHWNTKEK